MNISEIIHISQTQQLVFEQDGPNWRYFIQEGNRRYYLNAKGIFGSYREARIDAWNRLIDPVLSESGKKSYMERVGLYWDKLVQQPPIAIEVN